VRWPHAVVEALVQNDFTYVAIMLAMFAHSVLFVAFCDRIIGPDEAALTQRVAGAPEPGPEVAEPTEVAA
jgi:hypothetical protein